MTHTELQELFEIFAPYISNYLEAVRVFEEKAETESPFPMGIEIAQIELGRALLDLLGIRKARDPLEIFLEAAARRQANNRTIPRALREAVFLRDGKKCKECGSEEDIEIDHILPFSRGGLTIIENLQPLCRPCNGKKGARP